MESWAKGHGKLLEEIKKGVRETRKMIRAND